MKHLSLVIAIAAVGNCLAAESGEPLQLKQTIALSGVAERIDHFALGAAGDRLFVCALGNTVEIPTRLDSLGDSTEIARKVQIWREK
jgi:hypothetical protein